MVKTSVEVVNMINSFGVRNAAPKTPCAQQRTERRRAMRNSIFRNGVVSYWGTQTACVLRDISKTGCCLTICGGADRIPDDIKLKTDIGGPWRAARVMWRRGDDAGIRFTL